MQSPEKRIVKEGLERYNGNLAGILIFGSYNTGRYVQGVSDIDTIMLLNERKNLDFKIEQDILREKLKDLNLSIQHFNTIKDYEEHIYDEGSWSSWITVICGSRIIYSTPELEKFRKRLTEKPIPKKKLVKYIQNKDEFELEGYFKQRGGWNLSKALFAHLRRKLQMLSFYQGNELIFDYGSCLANLEDLEYRSDLENICELYEKREGLSETEIPKYVEIARGLTQKVVKTLNKK